LNKNRRTHGSLTTGIAKKSKECISAFLTLNPSWSKGDRERLRYLRSVLEKDAKQTQPKNRWDDEVSPSLYIITKISTDKSECREGIISDLYILK
jgi:hypothetical protein